MKTTPLHEWHVSHGAYMTEFGGYLMPLWYPAGAKREHLAVLTNAGIFDTSHMSVILVYGPDAFCQLQRCFTKDLDACIGKMKTPLVPGRCTNGIFLDEDGSVVDDGVLYQMDRDFYCAAVNAGMGELVTNHLKKHCRGCNVTITDLSDRIGKIDIQGIRSVAVMKQIIVDADRVFDGMVYYSSRGYFDESSPYSEGVKLVDGSSVMLSRSGYTGEFGFELYVEPSRLVRVWEMILKAGEQHGLISCGFAARDSLRAGAGLPLSHQDIGHWPFLRNPWIFALPYNSDRTGFTKDFIGRKALENVHDVPYTCPFTGYDLRKVSAHEPQADVIDRHGKKIGVVLSCVTDMGIDRHGDRIFSIVSPDRPEGFVPRGLSCGFVRVSEPVQVGDEVILRDTKREIRVSIATSIRPDRTARLPMKTMLELSRNLSRES
ncbi:aminomethyl transferase family protein [bacterium]|nr:aminomethyl transferase family protein [bacterium]